MCHPCICNNYLDILFKAFDLKYFIIENQCWIYKSSCLTYPLALCSF